MTRFIAFCKIVECHSFTRASEALGYTQAAVSQMVRSLEKEFGMTLFVRSRKEVYLTSEGEQIFPFVRKLVNSYTDLLDRASEINGLESGEIRIGTFASMSQRLLPGVMSDFSKKYPGIRFVLSPGDNTTLPEQIKNGMIDFGFVYPDSSKGLTSYPICRDCFYAVFPEGHPLSERDEVTLKELSSEPLIIVDEGGVNTVLDAFEGADIKPNVMYRIHDDNTILSMVEQGIGVSILPSMILDRAAYRLKTVKIKTPVVRTVCVTYLSDELLPIAATRFIRFLRENIGKYLPAEYVI